MDSLQSNEYPLEELMPLIREQLSNGKSIRFSPKGTSMLPMLRQGIDRVVLSPLPQKLKKYDLPLYQRENGQYVLHRIVETPDETFTCMGDNQFCKEPGIRREQLIALVSAFYRDGVRWEVTDARYRLYVRVWYGTRHLRRGFRWLKSHLRRLIK